jgi:hypothetical protein
VIELESFEELAAEESLQLAQPRCGQRGHARLDLALHFAGVDDAVGEIQAHAVLVLPDAPRPRPRAAC